MGISSDPPFLAVAAKRLCHLFPQLAKRRGASQASRARLADTIEALIDELPRHSPGY